MKNFIFKAALVIVIALLTYQLGVKPWLNQLDGKKDKNWADGLISHEQGKFDLIVVGEEPEGISAAVTASRLGAKTLLIASGKDTGGIVSKSMVVDFQSSYDDNGNNVNKGFFSELKRKLGDNFSMERYVSVTGGILNNEKNIEVIYNASIDSVIQYGNKISGVVVSVNGEKSTYYGQMFIDATSEGTLLKMQGEDYFNGSGDLNLKNIYMPARLNFELDGVNWAKVEKLKNSPKSKFNAIINGYTSSDININISNLTFFDIGDNKVIVQGLEVFNLDLSDKNAVKLAYVKAKNEVKKLIAFLKVQFKEEFKDVKAYRAADSFYFRENYHFKGEQTLGINDILENRDASDKIAIGAYPVDAGKLSDSSYCIVGKPSAYAIPLGCIIPLKTDNLLMVGNKISFSSLAESSAGTLSAGVTIGESSGVVAVYSLVKNITPRNIIKEDKERVSEIEELLKKQGVYLPDLKTDKKTSLNWAYPSVRQLNSLGLLEGRIYNDYEYTREASQNDMATILINGTYRISPDKDSLDLNIRLSPYFVNYKITPEIAGKILLAYYGDTAPEGQAYSTACKLGYIDKLGQFQISNHSSSVSKQKKYLTMDDIYNLCAINLKRFTGKDISG